ncbi:probable N-acetyltransferase HLS1 [Gastrolobium bilobum]|uniref:probable N-acetyltransferase HLS1 n=1 Tax=Gastrolobium bilobum TaxID=150636 RepID=UPI002AB0E947|nr:probable N-acetyltransferase HLS1 [Gastrolobium bilobum]
MAFKEFIIRSYESQSDRDQVENLERRCKVGPSESVLDTMGDPICRIRNSPMYMMLVAELDNELVGVIQGSIKVVTVHPPKDLAKVGYVLGLRVAPHIRRKGIGSSLVQRLEEWFTSNDVDYAYVATEKDNHASVTLFMNKFGYTKFRTPVILVNPVNHHSFRISSNIEIARLKVEKAESLYRRFMGSTEFFPKDIENILRNKLSLGTWVAYFKDENNSWGDFGSNGHVPCSWAMLSVWNSGEIFKLRLGKAPFSCLLFTKSWRLINKIFPCLKFPTFPNFFNPFGFYFMYGVYQEGAFSGKLVSALCQFVHNMAAKSKGDNCKIIVTEVGEQDELNHHIPHWKLLSCPDLWCIKALKNEGTNTFCELTNTPPRALFVDPREV